MGGCITTSNPKRRGRHTVIACPPGREKDLMAVPGTIYIESEGGYQVPDNVLRMGQRAGSIFSYEPDPHETTPSGLPLKMYQRRVVAALRQVDYKSSGAFNAGDPGLGKSISTLQTLWLDGYLHKPGIVCGPLASRSTWCSPTGDPLVHYGLQINPIDNSTEPDALKAGGWWFIHWDILHGWYNYLFEYLKPCSLIADESHLAMNLKGKRAQAALNLSKTGSIGRRYLLTGTPVPKDRLDLHGQLAICQPGQWSVSKRDFGIAYCGGHMMLPEGSEGGGWMVYEGRTNTVELRARLAGVYFRYTKEQVPNELPKLTRKRIDVSLSPEIRREYLRAQADILKYLRVQDTELPAKVVIAGEEADLTKGRAKAARLISTSVLKKILSKEKSLQAGPEALRLCQLHRRLVVATWKIDAAKNIYKYLKDASTSYAPGMFPEIFGPIDGSHKKERRDVICESFAAARWSILVCTRGSVGVSINSLNKADAILQVTPDWNPTANIQMESRLHREGATASEIFSYYMLAAGTIDDLILEHLSRKSEEAASLEEHDQEGMHLCADLDPSISTDADISLDELCSMLEATGI